MFSMDDFVRIIVFLGTIALFWTGIHYLLYKKKPDIHDFIEGLTQGEENIDDK